jgi:translocation and assembly module TamB
VRRDDHQLALSGSGRVRSVDGRIAVEGEFTADRGLIELRDEERPSLSSDVVIVSAEPAAADTPARLRLDVKLNLGEAFYVKGDGLDVRMEGGVRVTLEEGEIRPRAKGSVRVAEGHYRAYGQQLTVERGVLLFDGPLDNPKLDILAVRKGQRVEAGVAISGTALSPRTSLYSNPPVPDSQKLQYLVLGSGPGSAGDADFGLASTRAQPRQDEFVSFGAQLASAVYVSVGQSLRNADSFVQATLELTERTALQGRMGSENAVTLIYTWEYD